jgi:hypothetical protein
LSGVGGKERIVGWTAMSHDMTIEFRRRTVVQPAILYGLDAGLGAGSRDKARLPGSGMADGKKCNCKT